jgi:hypothetical protein
VRIGELVAFVLGALVLIALLMFLARKYHRYLDRAAAFSRECCIYIYRKSKPSINKTQSYRSVTLVFSCFSFHHHITDLKVLVSFVTVATTLEHQFGVVWPASFSQALDDISVLSLNFGVLLGGFCIADISFYQRLLSSTLLLLGAVGAIILRSRLTSVQASAKESRAKQGVFVAIYLLLFAYPVLSVKIVGTFACHDVDGVRYLRADYSVRCDSQEWKAMAAYAGVWMAYVIAFPLFILCKLWSYRGNTTAEQQGTNTPELVDLRFLLLDYKSFAPVLMWEVRKQEFLAPLCFVRALKCVRFSAVQGIEMIRKLLLSVIGSFWSTKSTMCIVTAFLISAFFLCAHLKYRPFKASVLDRVQTLALTMLTLLYFIGNLPPPPLHTTHLFTNQACC